MEPSTLEAGQQEASLTHLHTGGTHSPTARRSGERQVLLPAGKEALAGGCSNALPAHSRGNRLEVREGRKAQRPIQQQVMRCGSRNGEGQDS